MPLTDITIKGLKPDKKKYRVTDKDGMYLEVTPSGGKLWRFKYRFNGKYKLLALGKYPEVSLAKAREKLSAARQQLADGKDPAHIKKLEKSEKKYTFEVIANEWWNAKKPGWTESHAQTVYRRMEIDLLPYLKDRPIREITAREILDVLRKAEARGVIETAHRLAQFCSNIFLFALASGYIEHNPAADISKALSANPTKSHPAITKPQEIKGLLMAIDGFKGSHTVFCALRFAPLVFVRPGELRMAEWDEINFDENLWHVPSKRMKMKREHLVPLSRQAVQILRDIQPLTGTGQYIFPSIRTHSRPMSENTLNAALRRIGYSKEEMCSHGFRTMASTRLHEMGWPSDVVEFQLAHVDHNKIRGIYNRAEYLDQRTKMMQAWADYLDALKEGKASQNHFSKAEDNNVNRES